MSIVNKIKRFDPPIGLPLGTFNPFHATQAKPAEASQAASCALGENGTYADGVSAGRAQALAEWENQQDDIIQASQDLSVAVQTIQNEIENSHGRVISQILQTVLPGLVRHHQMNEIENFIRQVSAPTLQGCITVHTPAHFRKHVEKILQEMAANNGRGHPKFKVESNKVDTVTRVKWQGGGGEIDIAAAADQCLTLLEAYLNDDRGDKDAAK